MKVLVFDKIYVPGYGMGPFTTPIEINDVNILARIKLQSRIKVINENYEVRRVSNKNDFPIQIIAKNIENLENCKESKIEEINIEEDKVEEEIIIPEDEDKNEEVIEDIKEKDFNDYTISELKSKLDSMGIPYLYKDTKTTLIEKIVQNL